MNAQFSDCMTTVGNLRFVEDSLQQHASMYSRCMCRLGGGMFHVSYTKQCYRGF